MVKNWAAFCSYPNAPGVLEKLDARLSPNLGKVWFSVVFHGFLWFFMGFLWFCTVSCGFMLFGVVSNGTQWVSKKILLWGCHKTAAGP